MNYEIKMTLVITENGKEKYNLPDISASRLRTNGIVSKKNLLKTIVPALESALDKARP